MHSVGTRAYGDHMDTNAYARRVAASVTAAMEAGGHSQKSMAEATGIPRVTLIRRLRGVSPFTVTELHAIASELGVPVEDLTAANTEDVA